MQDQHLTAQRVGVCLFLLALVAAWIGSQASWFAAPTEPNNPRNGSESQSSRGVALPSPEPSAEQTQREAPQEVVANSSPGGRKVVVWVRDTLTGSSIAGASVYYIDSASSSGLIKSAQHLRESSPYLSTAQIMTSVCLEHKTDDAGYATIYVSGALLRVAAIKGDTAGEVVAPGEAERVTVGAAAGNVLTITASVASHPAEQLPMALLATASGKWVRRPLGPTDSLGRLRVPFFASLLADLQSHGDVLGIVCDVPNNLAPLSVPGELPCNAALEAPRPFRVDFTIVDSDGAIVPYGRSGIDLRPQPWPSDCQPWSTITSDGRASMIVMPGIYSCDVRVITTPICPPIAFTLHEDMVFPVVIRVPTVELRGSITTGPGQGEANRAASMTYFTLARRPVTIPIRPNSPFKVKILQPDCVAGSRVSIEHEGASRNVTMPNVADGVADLGEIRLSARNLLHRTTITVVDENDVAINSYDVLPLAESHGNELRVDRRSQETDVFCAREVSLDYVRVVSPGYVSQDVKLAGLMTRVRLETAASITVDVVPPLGSESLLLVKGPQMRRMAERIGSGWRSRDLKRGVVNLELWTCCPPMKVATESLMLTGDRHFTIACDKIETMRLRVREDVRGSSLLFTAVSDGDLYGCIAKDGDSVAIGSDWTATQQAPAIQDREGRLWTWKIADGEFTVTPSDKMYDARNWRIINMFNRMGSNWSSEPEEYKVVIDRLSSGTKKRP